MHYPLHPPPLSPACVASPGTKVCLQRGTWAGRARVGLGSSRVCTDPLLNLPSLFLGQEGDFIPGFLEGQSCPGHFLYARCPDSWAYRTGHHVQAQGCRATGGWTESPSPCVQLSAGVAGNSYVNGTAGLAPPGPPALGWWVLGQGCGLGEGQREAVFLIREVLGTTEKTGTRTSLQRDLISL